MRPREFQFLSIDVVRRLSSPFFFRVCRVFSFNHESRKERIEKRQTERERETRHSERERVLRVCGERKEKTRERKERGGGGGSLARPELRTNYL